MRRILLLLCLLLLASRVPAQTAEQLFTQANQLYQQGKVAEARDLYESIARTGYAGGELFYNLGNAYYKGGNVPKAILNYERAMRLMPGDDDLRHNLQLANLMITDRIEPAPRLFVWAYWDAVKEWFSLRGATLVAYAWFVIVAAMIGTLILARTYALRKTAALAAAGASVVFVFLLVVLLDKIEDVNRTDEAIVIAQIATVKNSPETNSSDAFVLHGGVKLQVVDRLNTWAKIRLADGKVGWLEAAATETI
jgi:tetratricopeptide (TPR) repeat protein